MVRATASTWEAPQVQGRACMARIASTSHGVPTTAIAAGAAGHGLGRSRAARARVWL